MADGVRHALFAHNADAVDGKHAVGAGTSLSGRAGKLVSTNAAGTLPNNIITKAPDADKLDGVNSSDFLRKTATAANSQLLGGKTSSEFLGAQDTAWDSDKLDGLDSTAFLRQDQSGTLRPLHFMADTGAENDLAATCTNYGGIQLVVVAPGPGVVEVSGTVQMRMNHTNGTHTNAFVVVGAATDDCGDGPGAGNLVLPATQPTGVQFDTVPVTRRFNIPAAGAYTYYINGRGTTTARFYYARINGTFFPTG